MHKLTESEQAIITKYDLYFEGRVSRLEATTLKLDDDVKEIKKDVRELRIDIKWLMGIMITGFGGLFAMMAHGFHWF